MANLRFSIKNHPPALKYLFLSEMWERFSFYGLKALLVLYIIKELHLTDGVAYGIFGAYATLLYASFIIAGHLTDKYLGPNKAIIFGAILITLGHFSLAFGEGFIFYMGLGFIICGTSFFKGNITSFLGEFYEEQDPRRDLGFTIFYIGINVGGLIAPILCGYIANQYNWHYGFGIAGIGMLFALITFISGIRSFEGKGKPKTSNPTKCILIYLGSFLITPLFAFFIQNYQYMNKALPIFGLFTLIYVIKIAINSDSNERENIITLGLMMIFVLIFLAFWEQIASSLTVFTDRYVNRDISFLNFKDFKELPTPWLQALNGIFVLILAPVFSFLWKSFDNKGFKIYTPFKFVIGFILLGLGFLAFQHGANEASIHGKTCISWLIFGYLLYTAGELAILPIGYAMVTKLAPKDKSSAFMGVWFMGFAFAQYIAASLAQLTDSSKTLTNLSSENALLFTTFFGQISSFTFITAIILFVIGIFLLKVFKKVE